MPRVSEETMLAAVEIAESVISDCVELAQEESVKVERVLSVVSFKIATALSGKLPEKQNKSWVYYIKSGDRVKIGVSINPTIRVSIISTMCPHGATLIGTHPGDSNTEKEIHEKFKQFRRNGEWFDFTNEIKQFIREACI